MANDASLITYVREVPVQREADVVVIGGGSAGLNAAVAAARAGCRVTLIERYGFLGGTSTAVLDTFYGFFTPGSEPRRVVGGIPMEVVNALFDHRAAMYRPNTYGAGTGITYNPAVLKRVWDEIVTRAGVDLLLHAFCVDVLAEGGEVRGVIVATKAGLLCVRGRLYVDASGDADVAARAGAAVESAYATGEVQSATTTFTLGGVDVPQAASVPRAEFVRLLQEAAASGEYDLPRKEGSIHRTPLPDVMVANMTRVPNVDGKDPASLYTRRVGRSQASGRVRALLDRACTRVRAGVLGGRGNPDRHPGKPSPSRSVPAHERGRVGCTEVPGRHRTVRSAHRRPPQRTRYALAVLAGGRGLRHSVPGAPSGRGRELAGRRPVPVGDPRCPRLVPQHGAVHGHGPSGGRRSGHGGKER